MSWKRHFKVIHTNQPVASSMMSVNDRNPGMGTSANFASFLPLVYAGHPNRIQRYYQFDDMDRDSDINAALDTIADFCTQSEEQTEEPFEVRYNSDPSESETKIIKTMLNKWVKLNGFRARLWYMLRDTLKNGDAFFLRDPETQEWLWLDHFMVEMVKIDDTMGKKPDEYLIRGLDYNRQTKFGSKQADPNQYRTPYGTSNIGASRTSSVSMSSGPAAFSLAGTASDPRQRHMLGPFAQEVSVVDAQYVIHLSLSIGNDINWPFGTSILEPIFKTYKQKELLEDAILIYRIQRAPERRIFYIDVGTMPPERAKRHIEAIKNDIHQRRIPNRSGTGGSILDSAYNPLCLALDIDIPLLDGRTLPLSDLIKEHQDGKENWVYSCDPVTGEIVPGNITWAGITRKDAEVIRITLDNGKTLTCTPDHKIPVLGRGDVEAKDLTADDSLIAFHTRGKNIDRNRLNERTYTQVYDHKSKKWVYVHRMVGEFFRNLDRHEQFTFLPEHTQSVKNLVHHKDYNRYNNNPNNLTYMNKEDHIAYHVFERQDYWNNLTEEERQRITHKISKSLKDYYTNLTPDQHERLFGNSSERNKAWIAAMRENNPDRFTEWRNKIGDARAAYFQQHPEDKAANDARLRKVCKVIQNQKFQSTQRMIAIMAQCVRDHGSNRIETAALLQNNDEFLAEISAANPVIVGAKSNINRNEITPPRLDKVIADFGYKNWKVFAKEARLYNHRIISIERIGNMDVGTITVDGAEEWHNYHTFAISSGIFVKNSTNDDYFFAQCLTIKTNILLLDGRTLSLGDIISEYEQGKKNWAYSLNRESHISEAGRIVWAGITRRDASLVRVTLDNDEYIDVTPDHRFILRDGSEVHAGLLKPDDSLMPLNNRANHKVVSVEILPERADTGDLTIESPSGSHVFALAAGVYVHNSSDGRGSKVETLPGGEQTGEISDLMFFSRKLARGLRVPISYLNLGEDDNAGVTFNDGKLGAAMVQEFRFTKYCMRWQSLLAPIFDKEFKRYLIKNGIEMEWSLFELQFMPPQSFTRYRQIELDVQRVQLYQGVSENRRLSERFKFKRFLGLSEEEMAENEDLWSEENSAKLKAKTGSTPAESGAGMEGLSAVGIRPTGDELPPEEMPPPEGMPGEAPGPAGAMGPGGAGGMPQSPAGAGPAG